jgi:uncharacterized membrane protein
MERAVKKLRAFIVSRLLAGVLVLAPIYLAALLLLKAMKSLTGFVRPLAKLLPEWLPADRIFSLLLVMIICLLVGITVRTRSGRAAWERMEKSLFQKIPGYAVVRGFTQQLAGESQGESWRPALAEIEEALVPAFIIEELEDELFTVFVPSVPTALSGAVYILSQDRVHRVNVPIAHVIKVVSRWGSGSKDLVAAMERKHIAERYHHR